MQYLDKGLEVKTWCRSCLVVSPSQDGTDDPEGGGENGTVPLGLWACQLVHVLDSIVFLFLTLAERVGGEGTDRTQRRTK